MIYDLESGEATRAWAHALARELRRPAVVRLEGDLGAGKTQIVRWLLEAAQVLEVASPTFAIHHVYPTAEGDIDHIDLYRLQSDDDLESTGFWDLLQQPNALVLVEWADRLPDDVWPTSLKTNVRVHIEKTGAESRRLTVTQI